MTLSASILARASGAVSGLCIGVAVGPVVGSSSDSIGSGAPGTGVPAGRASGVLVGGT